NAARGVWIVVLAHCFVLSPRCRAIGLDRQFKPGAVHVPLGSLLLFSLADLVDNERRKHEGSSFRVSVGLQVDSRWRLETPTVARQNYSSPQSQQVKFRN